MEVGWYQNCDSSFAPHPERIRYLHRRVARSAHAGVLRKDRPKRGVDYGQALTAHALRVFALRAFAHLRDFVIQTFAMVGERP
jgi:hypothetical protein